MTEILDDFSEMHLSEHRVQYYATFTFFILLLMNGGAYLQMIDKVQFTPVFGEYAGQASTIALLLSTALCYRKVLRVSWLISLGVGLLIMVIDFTIIFQIVIQFADKGSDIMFPFWTYISIGYVLISIVTMEGFARFADSRNNSKNKN